MADLTAILGGPFEVPAAVPFPVAPQRTQAERIEDALRFIPAEDRDLWLKIGTAIKSELGEAGFGIWDTWSQQSEKYKPKAGKSCWKSLKPGTVNIGTLYHEAKARGWRDSGAYQPLSPAELAERKRRNDETSAAAAAEESLRHAKAAENARATWEAATEAKADHSYLSRKGIEPHGARISGDALLIPMHDGEGTLWNLQTIAPNGDKRFLPGGRVTGCHYVIGSTEGAQAICVAEGFATGASIHEATGLPVAAAFNAGNLRPVAKALRQKFPDAALILCGDDDYRTDGNPGKTKATEAAQAVGGKLAIPDFGPDRPEGATDFNDLHALRGLEAVRTAIDGAARAEPQPAGENATGAILEGQGWPIPQPLAAKIEPEPYPLDALPDTIRAAVEDVAGFVKAPVPLVASSALAALSLACQAHIDVKRAEKLHGPVGLFLLTIADSGERKSTCDGFFMSALEDYEAEQAKAAKPALKDHRTAMQAWEAKQNGIKEKIRQLARDGKPTANLEVDLRDLEHAMPEPPRVPRLLYADATPEALAYNLSQKWPSGGVVSAEAGIVFGSHGMGKDSVMRNLATLNQLWDGNSLTIDRRTSESFTVKGARLTMALQVQEPTLREFFAKSGELARGTGFLARFLVAWPESTQGRRFFTEAPESWPHLAAFHRRIAEILAAPVPIDEDGALTPAMLTLTPEAKSAWVEYHDAIERKLASGGELYDVRDVASKSADNAARLAALFHLFEHDMGAIGADSFERASRIAAWHLSEARRFFGELALPAEQADAARLDGWLIAYCRRERVHLVGKNHVRQHGPLRDGARLDAAIRELAELDRLHLVKDGKRLTIHLNPALVGVEP